MLPQSYLNLQLRYLIVKGGNLTIGTADKPYVNRANITFIGLPNSLDLPMYGAKSMAVRDGVVTMFGQPKTPLYTTLNATVNTGATSITVNGPTNWQVQLSWLQVHCSSSSSVAVLSTGADKH